jgi:hypothetical protein
MGARTEAGDHRRDSSILSWFYIDISEKILYHGLFEFGKGTNEAERLSLLADDQGMAVNP